MAGRMELVGAAVRDSWMSYEQDRPLLYDDVAE
jgi:hypothetical protein